MDVKVQMAVAQLPWVAELAPHRSVRVGDAEGRCEIFARDDLTGIERQVTARPHGTTQCAITPDGRRIWWFDGAPTGHGVWRVQSFAGGRTRRALLGIAVAGPAGLAMSSDGTVAVGLHRRGRTTVRLRETTGAVQTVWSAPGAWHLLDLAPDRTCLAVVGDPSAAHAVHLLGPEGDVITTLSGRSAGADRLWGLGFSPVAPVLLLVAGNTQGYQLMTWDLHDGPPGRLLRVPGGEHATEITASWYPDGQRLLVRQERHGRSRLSVLDRFTGCATPLLTPAGSIPAAQVLPDGRAQYLWTDSLTPPLVMTGESDVPPVPDDGPGPSPHRSAARWPGDLWVDGPGGAVHALVTTPDRPGPYPTVFVVHGGPHEAARDAYDPLVDLLVRIGFAVVRVNYRGSTGYGPAWRRVEPDQVGFAQLEDLAAVRAHVVAAGSAQADRIAICGESWGGYLSLLAAGTQPDLWLAVAALSPVADYVTAHQDTTAQVQDLDRDLLGGGPQEVPARYRRISPITYVDRVRGPVLIVAGRQDVKCPPSQIVSYVRALRATPAHCELVWTDGEHDPSLASHRVQALQTTVHFLGRAFGGREGTSSPVGTHNGRPPTDLPQRSWGEEV